MNDVAPGQSPSRSVSSPSAKAASRCPYKTRVSQGINLSTDETFYYVEVRVEPKRWLKCSVDGEWETFATRAEALAVAAKIRKRLASHNTSEDRTEQGEGTK